VHCPLSSQEISRSRRYPYTTPYPPVAVFDASSKWRLSDGGATTTLDRLLDPELNALVTRVEEAHGGHAVSLAVERAYASLVRDVRAKMKSGEVPATARPACGIPTGTRRASAGTLAATEAHEPRGV